MGNAMQVFEFLKNFMGDSVGRQLGDQPFCKVADFTDDELCQAIVDDILAVTMFERVTTNKIGMFDKEELVKFAGEENKGRIKLLIHRVDIKHLIVFHEDGNLRIPNEHEILQAAMDYCGCVYDGFKMVEGEQYFSLNMAKIEEMGGIEAVAEQVAMDIVAEEMASEKGMPVPESKMVN